jgi:hypothetical protein
VAEVHAVLKQFSAIVSEAVELRFEAPKPSPLIVTDEPPLFARFVKSRLLTLTMGAEACEQSVRPTKPCNASGQLYRRS